MTNAEIELLRKRRDAAISALRFFKDIKGVKSTNNPFVKVSKKKDFQFNLYRDYQPDSVLQGFEDAARTGIGNCDEKARICFASLVSNPTLQGNTVVAMASSGTPKKNKQKKGESDKDYADRTGYDHVFVMLTDAEISRNGTKVGNFGLTAMVVDGWTEDWHAPNLSWLTAVSMLGAKVPNPRQLVVRTRVRSHLIHRYRQLDVGTESGAHDISTRIVLPNDHEWKPYEDQINNW